MHVDEKLAFYVSILDINKVTEQDMFFDGYKYLRWYNKDESEKFEDDEN